MLGAGLGDRRSPTMGNHSSVLGFPGFHPQQGAGKDSNHLVHPATYTFNNLTPCCARLWA